MKAMKRDDVILFLLFGLLLIINIFSASRIPLPSLDEVHLVEIGRNLLDRDGMQASFLTERTGFFTTHFYYLGSVTQEWAYRVFGFPAPRIITILAFLLASVLCRYWLLYRGEEEKTARLFSLMFMVQPVVVQSSRTRLDAWAFVFCFSILLLITTAKGLTGRARKVRFCWLGFLAAGSLFVWPTALVFFLIYLYEMLRLKKQINMESRALLSLFGFAICGGLLGILLFLIPVSGHLMASLFSFESHVTAAVSVASGTPTSVIVKFWGVANCLLREFLRDPLFMVFVGVGLITSFRDRHLLVCFSAAVGLLLLSGLYIFRLLYLMPFLLLFVLSGVSWIRARYPKCATGSFFVMLFYQSLCGFVIPFVVSFALMGRSHQRLVQKLKEVVGGRGVNVYSQIFQTYYAGKDLGWNQSRYFLGANILDDSTNARLLSKADVIIDANPQRFFFANEEGFTLYHLIRDYAIYCARCEVELQNKSFFARLGTSFAGRPPSAEDQAKMGTVFMDAGFEKKEFIDMTTPRMAYKPWQWWIVDHLGVISDYDSFIIWKRKHPAGSSSLNK